MGEVARLTNATTGGPVYVDVHDGRIVRITPVEVDETDAPSRTVEARGRRFSPPRKTTLSPYSVGHRSMIYSPKRILTPLHDAYLCRFGPQLLSCRGGEMGGFC